MQATAATVISSISTVQGGADAEIREFETASTGELGGGVPLGLNRGGSTELATRVNDGVDPHDAGASSPTPANVTNWFRTGDRSSIQMVKIKLSDNLPAPLLNPNHGFWTHPHATVTFRNHVRNATGFQNLFGPNPSDVNEIKTMTMRVRALEPGQTYLDDLDANGQAAFLAGRTDRLGTHGHNATEWKYNWTEGTLNGAVGAGVTFYNAPGIQPHCTAEGDCYDSAIAQDIAAKLGTTEGNLQASFPAVYASMQQSLVQTLGIYDDFDPAYVRSLGTYTPVDAFIPPENTGGSLPIGRAVDFTDEALKELIHDAIVAGREYVTLFTHIDIDGTKHQPNTLRPGTYPDQMLNRNYLYASKECENCATSGTNTPHLGNSTTGVTSPKLIFAIPEPSSMVLFGLGTLMMGLVRRRA